MEDRLILSKEHLKSFLRKISKRHELIAPVKNSSGDTLLEAIPSLDEVTLDLKSKPVMPAKNFFLPRSEVLFKYQRKGKQYSFDEVLDDTPRILFGLRSCDLWGILFLDMIFQENFKDRYYLNRRINTVLINIGCNEPMENCFCRSTKSGPFLTHGYDLQLTDLGDKFFVEIGRPRGRELVEEWNYFFSPATKKDREHQYEMILEAESRFHQIVDMNTAISRFMNDEIDERIWDELGNRCQNCGGCAYVCPTCYCFNIVDMPLSENAGERKRIHDSCTFTGFTRLAGGYNPRHEKKRRIRRRFYHKLYYENKKHRRPSCVGCGRCVEICFGRVDMINFIKMVCERGERSLRESSLRLGEILIEAGLLNREELKNALERQASTGESLGTQLIKEGLITREGVARALGYQLKIPENAGTGGSDGK
ncbi:MAG: 4Fe-4S dicluster domain-containing protein [Proteobacteria bacterium]|nr:4Fe-4S dicluster domain-containing protein [Pseudomonadota bacterium]MBU4258434.1 4Fe-4S dicluster domain-containing protein [Pseudomonadota bacterium]MBU4288452.1 4Fe-4S dicluster domain-containing protein [Pseudomonadota bacterium]MBU4414636.1 4Fe-4S dicluster domain-containing protein [Pseudomonadota bacterium]MCG2758148.1 4Fe-4S dicluster domain-containing protein [Desulfobacteraceae bacterium]